MIKKYLICGLLLWGVLGLQAQSFRGGVVFGANASQINGDFIAGFNKVGLHLGLKVEREVTERISWSTELLYSERGSRTKGLDVDPFTISINYVEIPLLISFKDWMKDDFYKMRFEAGVSAGRVIGNKVKSVNGDTTVEGLNETDFSFTVGPTIYTSPNLGFTLRYTHSINLLRSQKDNPNLTRYRGYFLTLRATYML